MADEMTLFENSKVENTFFLKGTCLEMCPARERSLREKQRRLHIFEMIEDVSDGKTSQKTRTVLAVKEYSRPAAGRHIEASELRPGPVLLKTMDYLLNDILSRPETWLAKCEFISDRIRAIRQDLTAQGLVNLQAIEILEKAVRYYLVTAVMLCNEPVYNFDPVLHDSQMKQCLKKLITLYNNVELPGAQVHPNQATFEACYLLVNIDNPYAFQHIMKLPNIIKKSSIMKLTIQLTKACSHGNYVSAFRVFQGLPLVESCAFFHHIERMRCNALKVMSIAYNGRNLSFPLEVLTKVFCFQSIDAAQEFCHDHGIASSEGKVFFCKETFVEAKTHKPCGELVMSKLKAGQGISEILLFQKQTTCNETTINETRDKLVGIGTTCSQSKAEMTLPVRRQEQQVAVVAGKKTVGLGRGRGRKHK